MKSQKRKKTQIPTFRNQDGQKIKVRNEKVHRLLPNVPMCTIIELIEIIYAGDKLPCDKIGVPQKKPKRNTKPG